MPIQRLRRSSVFVGLFLALYTLLGAPVHAATLPSGFTEALVASGLSNPTAMQFAPDGRLFVCEQGGRLRVIKNGSLLPAAFATLPVDSNGERGLLGVAFDPGFATNNFVYVYYTATTPTVHNRISRLTANGDVAVAGSEVVIFDLDTLSSATNHNGGALAFGPSDGRLYAAVGENNNSANAQSLGTVLGKMLRLNADGTIPSDNPFLGSTSGKNRAIWALGLRNPFTFAFNPFGTEMFINDVGETTWEEINDGVAGANYGWPTTEGPTTNPAFTSPRYAYNHSSGGCAITGGAFYAPVTGQFPSDYLNDYFFADYCAGWIRKLDPAAGNTVTTFATGISAPVDLKVGDDGSLYYLARGEGSVYRVEYAATGPTITSHPTSQTVAPGASATFSVRASGPPPLTYQWRRNNVDIPGATAQDYTIASVVAGDNGARFRANVSNNTNSVLSNEATLTVTSNQAPTGTILQPAAGTLYSGGTAINYAGTATDPEDGTLPASAFTWQVDFHHDTHVHPFIPATTGAQSGSFTIPTIGETSANVWYRLYLTVRDAGGLPHTTQRDILPRKVVLTLATNPAGLQLKLDGQPVATPLSFNAVVGMVRTIEATTPQSSGTTTYTFTSWSDGGAASHSISTPATNTTYTATYQGSVSTGPPITLLQHAGKDAGTTTSSSLAFPSANTAGRWIGVAIRAWQAGQTFTVTDTRGNTYRKAVQLNETVDMMSVAIYYAENIAGGANTVTVSDTQSGTLRFAIFEYAGIATSNSLDGAAGAQGTSANPTSGSATTTSSGNLVMGVLATANPRTFTAGSGYVIQERVPAPPDSKLIVEDRLQPSAGPVSAGGSLNSSDIWGAVVAAFRAASPPANQAPTVNTGADQTITLPASATLAGTVTDDGLPTPPGALTLSWTRVSGPGTVTFSAPTAATTTATFSAAGTYVLRLTASDSALSQSDDVSVTVNPDPAPAPITLLQHAGKDAGTTTSSSLAFPSNNTAGRWIGVAIRAWQAGQTFTVTDTRGNTYRKAVQFNETVDRMSIAIYYAENIAGGANTVTVSDTQSGTLRFAIFEYAGIATSNSLDGAAGAQGTSANPTSGSATTTSSGNLVMGVLATANPRTFTAGSGYIIQERVPAPPDSKLIVEDRRQPTAGPVSAGGSLNSPDVWGAVVAAFRAGP